MSSRLFMYWFGFSVTRVKMTKGSKLWKPPVWMQSTDVSGMWNLSPSTPWQHWWIHGIKTGKGIYVKLLHLFSLICIWGKLYCSSVSQSKGIAHIITYYWTDIFILNKNCTHSDIKLLKWVTESLFGLSWLFVTVFLSVSMNVWGLGLKSSKILYILYLCQVLHKRRKPWTCKGSIKGSGES